MGLSTNSQRLAEDDFIVAGLVEVADAGFHVVAARSVKRPRSLEAFQPRCLDQEYPCAAGRQRFFDVADQGGAAPLALAVRADSDHVQVPRSVGHPFRCEVRHPHRPTVVVRDPTMVRPQAAIK